jgi:hypothetical protein
MDAVTAGLQSDFTAGLNHADVEELAEADGEEEAAVEGVFDRGDAERTRAAITEGEEDSAREREGNRDPVVKKDVHESECGCAEEDRGCAGEGREQRAVAMEKEGAVNEALGKYGEDGIKDHDASPGGRLGSRQGQEKVRSAEADEERQDGGCGREEGKHLRELAAKSCSVPEAAAIERGVTEEDCEAPCGDRPENRERRKAGSEAEVERQRQGDEEEKELGREEQARVTGNILETGKGTGNFSLRRNGGRDRTVRSHIRQSDGIRGRK